MATDLTVVLEDRPGTLAQLGETLGQAGINIDGSCGVPCAGEGVIHLLVEDAVAARSALGAAGIEVRDERPVLLATAADRPGELGKLARRIASAGVNIELFYLTTRGQVVLGVDNLEKARAAL
jgi:hypothetical protein